MALTERIRGSTLASLLAHAATTDPGRIYLRYQDREIPVAQVDSDSESLAAALANLGVHAGDRIALVLPPRPEFAVAMFAAAKLGAQVVPLNPRASTVDLQYMLRQSGASCAVTIERAFGLDYLEIFEDLMPQLPELQYVVTVGEEDLWYDDRIFQYEDLLSSGAGRDYDASEGSEHASSDDTFALVYTSGTMGKAKAVELSHANLLAAAAGTAEGLGLEADDRVVGVTALFHVFGLAPGLLSTLLSGAALVLHEDAGAASTLDDAQRHGATVHYGIPTLFMEELREQRARPRDLSSLRLALLAGAPVGDELVRDVAEAFGATVLTAYSITEASSTATMATPSDPEQKRRFTVGRPLPGTTIRILGPDGAELPEESVGEIRIQGPGVMRGYYRQPRETSSAFDPGRLPPHRGSGHPRRGGFPPFGRPGPRTLSFDLASTCIRGRSRLASSPTLRFGRSRSWGSRIRCSAKPSVPASCPWRARSCQSPRSWTGAAKRLRTTRSPTSFSSGTSFPVRIRVSCVGAT